MRYAKKNKRKLTSIAVSRGSAFNNSLDSSTQTATLAPPQLHFEGANAASAATSSKVAQRSPAFKKNAKKLKFVGSEDETKEEIEAREHFDGGVTALDKSLTTVYSKNVPAKFKAGLKSVAADLNHSNILLPNKTVNYLIDLTSKKGGKEIYRFTYKRKEKRIYIEKLGIQNSKNFYSNTSDKKFQKYKFRASGFSSAEKKTVFNAVNKVPNKHLKKVIGLKFSREHIDASTGAAQYMAGDHKVEVFNGTFKENAQRIGTVKSGFSDFATRAIVHEIGHAIDLHPLNVAFKHKGFLKKRSASGHKWKKKKRVYHMVYDKNKNPFEKAAKKDGLPITKYAGKNKKEAFAEAYSFFITDPETFEMLRPNLYKFFIGL